MRRALKATAVVAGVSFLAVVSTACRNGGDGISDAARSELQAHTRQVRAAAEAGDRSGTEVALGRFRTAVARLQSERKLPPDRAERFLALAAGVEATLALLPPPPPTTQPPPPTTNTTQSEDRDKDEGRGNRNGKGDKGKGDGD